jgi:hypothetical protein
LPRLSTSDLRSDVSVLNLLSTSRVGLKTNLPMNDGLILRSRDHSKHDFGHAVLLAPNDGDSGTEKAGGEGSHLAYAFVDVGAGRQL